MMARYLWILAGILTLGLTRIVCANDTARPSDVELDHDNPCSNITIPNLPLETLGGNQLWGDEFVHLDWRIQRNTVTGHYRLLDEHNVRHHWGTWQECYDKWDVLKEKHGVPPLRARVVLVLHGLGRTRHSMESMVTYLREKGEFDAMSVTYPSTRQSIEEHAKGLGLVIDRLGPEVAEIHFVAHSLGNLVIRQYLHATQQKHPDRKVDPRIGRMVMLGPPNQDAAITRVLGDTRLFRWALPGTGRQLAEELPQLSRTWGNPPCDVAIIAGGKSDGKGWNPLLDGDDDLIVRVEETKLSGAKQFMCVPVIHTFLMDDPHVQQVTCQFLQQGP